MAIPFWHIIKKGSHGIATVISFYHIVISLLDQQKITFENQTLNRKARFKYDGFRRKHLGNSTTLIMLN